MEKKRILVIDDEPNLLEVIRLRLEANDYEVLTAQDPLAGLEIAKEEMPDLIIMDVIMPKVNGLRLLRILKREDETKDIPVIILSVKWHDNNHKAGVDAGADYYLTKPYDPKELLDTVKKVLEKR
ncbi:MAG: response regulator [Candidatus Omnitrophica bacterium]|nr:response regulator [Candidatus Omnitrophota bacterium]